MVGRQGEEKIQSERKSGVKVRVRVRRIISRFCRMGTVVVLELQQPQTYQQRSFLQIRIGEQTAADKMIGVMYAVLVCVMGCGLYR